MATGFTFNGTAIFGTNASVQTADGRRTQRFVQTVFPGVNGGGAISLGRNPIAIRAIVTMRATTVANLETQKATAQTAVEAGAIGNLINDWGTTYPDVVLEELDYDAFPGVEMADDGTNKFQQRCIARFRKLS